MLIIICLLQNLERNPISFDLQIVYDSREALKTYDKLINLVAKNALYFVHF